MIPPAVKWHGGKNDQAAGIVARMPPHRVYVEPFAGGANVLLRKPRSAVEVLGDVHPDLINLYRVLRDEPAELLSRLRALEYRKDVFERARDATPADPMGRAVRMIVVQRMSRGGDGVSFAESDRLRGKTHPDGPIMGDANAWRTFTESGFRALADRLRAVELVEAPAVEVIRRYDAADALFYCDPPYLHETRTHRSAYAFEMTDADHRELLATLKACRGSVILSGYRSALYDHELRGWDRIEREVPNNAGQGRTKGRRVECLWSRPADVPAMFVRWKRRQRSSRKRPTGQWVRYAVLARCERLDGRPRQQFIAHLGTIRQGHEGHHWHRVNFWAKADRNLAALDLDVPTRERIEATLAGVVPRPDQRSQGEAEGTLRSLERSA
jgi:DNA adenine methylase